MHVLCLLDVFANLTIFAHFFAIFFGYIHICGCHGPSGHQVVAKWSPSDLLVVDKWSFSCHQVVTKLSTSGHQVIIHSQKWSVYAPFTPKADNVHFLPFLPRLCCCVTVDSVLCMWKHFSAAPKGRLHK